jgi:hypothetical protein
MPLNPQEGRDNDDAARLYSADELKARRILSCKLVAEIRKPYVDELAEAAVEYATVRRLGKNGTGQLERLKQAALDYAAYGAECSRKPGEERP